MKKLIIHNDKIVNIKAFTELCPFNALEYIGGKVEITAGCRMCGVCVKKCDKGEAEYIETIEAIDKTAWCGICVYADHEEGVLHPITFELLGKAHELAEKIGCKVYALLIGHSHLADELLHYGVDKVYSYGNKSLDTFKIEPYTAVVSDFINTVRPAVILVGATQVGRQLAPRVAARFETGLTADCTVLEIEDNTDLIQIRPAFGGNIMARILTPNHRPQLATVRYKVMTAPKRSTEPSGEIINCEISEKLLISGIEHISKQKKEAVKTIEGAEIIIAAGRGVRAKEDLDLLKRLAELLGGELACTRPLAENGWIEARRQIGLSGRTVRPKLIIACGISGAVQFTAGMNGSERIFAINKDANAPIFKTAHFGLVGDIYEIVPKLIAQLEGVAK